VNGFEQSERIVMLDDMNSQVGDMEVEEVIVKEVFGEHLVFSVPVMNWTGRRMMQFCTEAGLIEKTYDLRIGG
jgi:isopentenyldiphosphate isomerase